jgi:hypothetical protein
MIENGGPPRDDKCKVGAFGNEFVFISTGRMMVRYESGTQTGGWDNLTEARSAYEAVTTKYSTARSHTADIAIEWAHRIQTQWNAYFYSSQDRLSRMQELLTTEPGLTTALFGGVSSDGGLELVAIQLGLVAGPVASEVSANLTRFNECPIADPCVIGKTEVVSEFSRLGTPRAIQEQAIWSPNDDDEGAPHLYLLKRATRMVELTIKHDPSGTVGGPIDAVRPSRDGGTAWYSRKPNCE